MHIESARLGMMICPTCPRCAGTLTSAHTALGFVKHTDNALQRRARGIYVVLRINHALVCTHQQRMDQR